MKMFLWTVFALIAFAGLVLFVLDRIGMYKVAEAFGRGGLSQPEAIPVITPEMQALCAQERFIVPETKIKVAGFASEAEQGCGPTCQRLLLYIGFSYIEAAYTISEGDDSLPPVSLVNRPGVYRFTRESRPSDNCAAYEARLDFEMSQPGRTEAFDTTPDICIGVTKIEAFTAAYLVRRKPEKLVMTGEDGTRLLETGYEIVTAASSDVVAETKDYIARKIFGAHPCLAAEENPKGPYELITATFEPEGE